MTIWRSRWAAIGAAVAVTFGAGGLWSAQAADPTGFVGIDPPVRVVDTRIDVGLAGPFTSGEPRNVKITGNVPTVGADGQPSTGAPIPDGAGGVILNATLVGPTANAGFLSVRPGTATGTPTTSNLNFTSPGVVVPNNVAVKLPTSGDHAGELNIFFQGSEPGTTTHVLIDVVGYFDGNPLQGPQGEKGDQGDPGPAGADGADGRNTWDVLPMSSSFPTGPVFTVTGEILISKTAAGLGDSHFTIVTLPGIAPKPLTSDHVNFSPSVGAADILDSDEDASCNGSVAAPTAPPGKVCLYYNITHTGGVEELQGRSAPRLTDRGFVVRWQYAGGIDPMGVSATWAYTTPRAPLPGL